MTCMRLILAGLLLSGLGLCGPAQAFCFQEAGSRYHIDPLLLRSIATVESQLNPQAIGQNRDSRGRPTSKDYGLMQINARQIPQLRALGIIHSERDLLNNSCLNVEIGAWILARHLQHCGVNWQCLGSYNAGFADDGYERRMRYARKVYARYRRLRGV